MLLLHITKEVRGKDRRITYSRKNIRKKYEKYPFVLKSGLNKKIFISQDQKLDITLTPQVYDRTGCKIIFLCHENLKFQLYSCSVGCNINSFKFFCVEKKYFDALK